MTVPFSTLVVSLAIGVASGLLGCFALMRRMALASDALSHVALPGIALALLVNLDPLAGALAALGLGAALVWAVQRRSRIGGEAVIGVLFSAALALGAIFARGEELLDALFGSPGPAAAWESAFGLAGALAVSAFVLRRRDALVVSLVSPDIARTAGIRVARLDLLFLLHFALTVALGLRFLGVLLMGSLIIIPAATARHLARGLHGMLAIAAGAAALATVAGTLLALSTGRESGPPVVAIAAALFFLSLLRPRRA